MTKLTKYPEGLDTANDLPDIGASDRMNAPGMEHHAQHTRLNQAVVALQKKVGENNSADVDSHEFRIIKLEESPSGGAGLTLADAGEVVGGGGEMILPDRPAVFFEVVSGGVRYALPGYEIKELSAPAAFGVGLANLHWAHGLESGTVWQESEVPFGLVFASDFKIEQIWE